ncbi:MAG: hypothetical protein JSS49_05685 [Planctomycetes bacterium]|nr:hypothetical protein [Planctomycetota bacterium]
MDGFNLAQIAVSVVAVTLIVTPLIVMAFLAGRRSHSHGRNAYLDHLRPEVSLGGTWRADFDADEDPSVSSSLQLELQQIGCRILATGRSRDGTRHSLEGVIHLGRICCVSVDDGREGAWLGTITAEVQADQHHMTGMRTRWSGKSQTLMVRKVKLTRLDNHLAVAPPDVAP